MQTEISDASRLVETARREPLGMSLTWLTNSKSAARPDQAREQIGQALARAFDARRHDAGGDDRRLEQAEIVARKIKNFGQAVMSAVAPRSTLVRRKMGSSITRRYASTGGRGAASRP